MMLAPRLIPRMVFDLIVMGGVDIQDRIRIRLALRMDRNGNGLILGCT